MYEIEGTSRFSKNGKLGVWLFLASPFVAAIGLIFAFDSIGPSGPILLVIGGFAGMVGAVLMLIGMTIERISR